jgi:hypothetical protein
MLTCISRAIGYFDWSSAKLLGPEGSDGSPLARRLPCRRHVKNGKKGNNYFTDNQKDFALRISSQEATNQISE